MAVMHEIDYRIFGDDMQFVEVELDPNEATVAEAGGMMYMEDGVEMEPSSATDHRSSAVARHAHGGREAAPDGRAEHATSTTPHVAAARRPPGRARARRGGDELV